jgi:hypothetical protein
VGVWAIVEQKKSQLDESIYRTSEALTFGKRVCDSGCLREDMPYFRDLRMNPQITDAKCATKH